MNIFIMILLAVVTIGYYVLNSPSQKIPEQETQYAVKRSDLHSVAECAISEHNAQIRGETFEDICVKQNGISSSFVCLDSGGKITDCEIVGGKKPAFSYTITATDILPAKNYNSMMEILEKYYSDSGTFGILMDGQIISGGASNKRTVPKEILAKLNLKDGQLIYMTQYKIPGEQVEFAAPIAEDIICPAGTIKTYRFGRWQCIEQNLKTNCPGDTIWDFTLEKCVANQSRRPLCAPQQTAVLIDEVWQCVNPSPTKKCPDKEIARLNYNTLEWECVMDPNQTEKVKKCANVTTRAVSGAVGTTMKIANSCTDCERMITDQETCISICIPDKTKLYDPKCYQPPKNPKEKCEGHNRAFYFGFPSQSYISDFKKSDAGKQFQEKEIPLNDRHAKNRKFNCLDCGETGEIDGDLSVKPYTAFCK